MKANYKVIKKLNFKKFKEVSKFVTDYKNMNLSSKIKFNILCIVKYLNIKLFKKEEK